MPGRKVVTVRIREFVGVFALETILCVGTGRGSRGRQERRGRLGAGVGKLERVEWHRLWLITDARRVRVAAGRCVRADSPNGFGSAFRAAVPASRDSAMSLR